MMGCLCRKSTVQFGTEEDTNQEKCLNRDKCKRCGKKFLAFLFSQVGLTGLVIGYSFLGAFIFQQLEQPRELKVKEIVNRLRQNSVEKLWDLTFSLNVLNRDVWSGKANKHFQEFQDEVFMCTKELGWNGSDDVNEIQWTFAGSLLYAVTTITTIGYGHIAPKTGNGRIATIVYALIGIPLMLLCLANIGGVLGKCFKFVYSRICCGLCRWHKARKAMKKNGKGRRSGKKSPCGKRRKCYSLCCVNESIQESNRDPESSKQSYQGDVAEAEDSGLRNPVQESTTSTVPYVTDPSLVNQDQDGVRVIVEQQTPKPSVTEGSKQTSAETEIPLVVTVVTMTLYVMGGSLLFTLWEKDWNFLEGTYFCVITLSTIGFGDLVPGVNFKSHETQGKLVFCAIYLIFGLALLAMCFELMQERVRFICKRIGRCLGIVGTAKNVQDENQK